MQNPDKPNLSPREISSLFRLLDSGTEENIQLALSIFEGNPSSPEIFNKIKKDPALILTCIQEGHQNILAQLRFIYLRRMGLMCIPVNIKYLKNIIMLDLGYNQISELPKEIYQLSSLKKLRLHDNQLKSIAPEISKLINLEELALDTNQMQELPASIQDLKKLRKINLAHNQLSVKQLQWIRTKLFHIQIDIL